MNPLDTWIGHDVAELIQTWGIPASQFPLPDGRTLYSWRWVGGVIVLPVGNFAVANQPWCDTTFTVARNGLVQMWATRGHACR